MSNYTHTVTAEEAEENLTINQILRRNFKFSSRFKTKIKFQKLADLNGNKRRDSFARRPATSSPFVCRKKAAIFLQRISRYVHSTKMRTFWSSISNRALPSIRPRDIRTTRWRTAS